MAVMHSGRRLSYGRIRGTFWVRLRILGRMIGLNVNHVGTLGRRHRLWLRVW